MLLALDTSTQYASLALAEGETLLAELNWRVGQRHGSETLARARWLLREQGVAMSALTAVAVALGPGSFNGVRVAVATAKTLAFALGVPLYGVPTLDIIAWGARLSPYPIWALLDAGRGEVYAACYDAAAAPALWGPMATDEDLANGGATTAYQALAVEALADRVASTAIFTGEWREATRETLVSRLGERARFTAPLDVRRGAWLAELAGQRARLGLADDPRALEPLYVRRPNITRSARGLGGAPTSNQRGGEEAAHAL